MTTCPGRVTNLLSAHLALAFNLHGTGGWKQREVTTVLNGLLALSVIGGGCWNHSRLRE